MHFFACEKEMMNMHGHLMWNSVSMTKGRKCGTFQVSDEKSGICIQERGVDGGAGTGISILS